MEQTLTIRDIVRRQIIPVQVSTVFTWMAPSNNFFQPVICEKAPVGPGEGCRVNKSDMVTIGIYHSIFAAGVKFKMLKLQGGDVPNAIVIFQREIKGAPKLNSIGGRMPAHTWIADTPAKHLGPGREIQRFLEEFKYKVWVSIARSRITGEGAMVGDGRSTKNVRFTISIFPATQAFKDEHLDRVGAVMPWESITFVNAQHWARRVDHGMR